MNLAMAERSDFSITSTDAYECIGKDERTDSAQEELSICCSGIKT